MRGLDRLLTIRRQGLRPEGFVALWAHGTGQRQAFEGHVLCEEADSPATADLRPFFGLDVHVIARGNGGFDEGEAWARAVMAVGAKTVLLSAAVPPEQGYLDGPAWLRWNGKDLA